MRRNRSENISAMKCRGDSRQREGTFFLENLDRLDHRFFCQNEIQQQIIRGEERSPRSSYSEYTPGAPDSWINHCNEDRVPRKIAVCRPEKVPSVPNILRLDAVGNVDYDGEGIDGGDNSFHHADVRVQQPKIGQESDHRRFAEKPTEGIHPEKCNRKLFREYVDAQLVAGKVLQLLYIDRLP
jgi:hypothetical protein